MLEEVLHIHCIHMWFSSCVCQHYIKQLSLCRHFGKPEQGFNFEPRALWKAKMALVAEPLVMRELPREAQVKDSVFGCCCYGSLLSSFSSCVNLNSRGVTWCHILFLLKLSELQTHLMRMFTWTSQKQLLCFLRWKMKQLRLSAWTIGKIATWNLGRLLKATTGWWKWWKTRPLVMHISAYFTIFHHFIWTSMMSSYLSGHIVSNSQHIDKYHQVPSSTKNFTMTLRRSAQYHWEITCTA